MGKACFTRAIHYLSTRYSYQDYLFEAMRDQKHTIRRVYHRGACIISIVRASVQVVFSQERVKVSIVLVVLRFVSLGVLARQASKVAISND